MKLLDRYIAISFLKNYLISFLVLVGMYVVLDMIFNFDELVEINTKGGITGLQAAANFITYVADYYFYQVFLYFLHLSAIIPIVAAAFTLMRMVRFNELSALLSAGVPLLRIAMPIIIVSLLLNGLLWVDQEMVIPNIVNKLVRKHDYGADVNWFAIAAMQDDQNGKLFAARYYPDGRRMEHISIVQTDEQDQPASHIKADRATWDPDRGGWKLLNGKRDINLSPHQPQPVRQEDLDYYVSNITPEEIRLYRSGDFVELLSTQRINELLQRPRSYGRAQLLRVKHTRGTPQIVANMVMLLLAVASVLTREPGALKMAAGKCVVLCGACMIAIFMSHQMAETQPIIASVADYWPALMAWSPIFLYGPMAVILLDRVKT